MCVSMTVNHVKIHISICQRCHKSGNKRVKVIRNITAGFIAVGGVGRNYKHDCKKKRHCLNLKAEEIDALYVSRECNSIGSSKAKVESLLRNCTLYSVV